MVRFIQGGAFPLRCSRKARCEVHMYVGVVVEERVEKEIWLEGVQEADKKQFMDLEDSQWPKLRCNRRKTGGYRVIWASGQMFQGVARSGWHKWPSSEGL
jgi:hypothetical protein